MDEQHPLMRLIRGCITHNRKLISMHNEEIMRLETLADEIKIKGGLDVEPARKKT